MAGSRTRKKRKTNPLVRIIRPFFGGGGFYDFSLLFITLLLACFGLIMIYSTSYYSAVTQRGDAAYYLKRQGLMVIVGIVAMLLVSRFDYRMLLKWIGKTKMRWPSIFLVISVFLQIFVLVAGVEYNGAKRWISLGPLGTFQPSDFAKLAIIVYTAYMIHVHPRLLDNFRGFIRIALFVVIDIGLVGIENMSTAIIMSLILGGMCFIASKNKKYFWVLIVVAAVVLVAVLNFGEGFRMARVEAWRNVETDKNGYQILQGLYAIASGGIFGKGLGQSTQKLGYVPEAQNDMIFSIICEELGVFGACCIVLLFIMMLWRIFQIAVNSKDLFGGMICVGVLVHIAAQVLLNIAVVTNTVPSTGVALPFISYGGTSVAVLLVEVGVVLSVSNRVTSD